MFTVTLIDSTVRVEKDYVTLKDFYCKGKKGRENAVAIFQFLATYWDVQGLLTSDSGIIN
jgi:hypothetical protein